MDPHLSSKNSKNVWMNVSPNLKSRGRELGRGVGGVRVRMAHTCYPNPWEVEVGRGSGVRSEFEVSLDYVRLSQRETTPGSLC